MPNDSDWPGFGPEPEDAAEQGGIGIEPTDVPACFARCFSTPDGRRVLAHLRGLAFGQRLGPEVSEAMLRHVEGQRHLLARIVSLIRRGSGAGPRPQQRYGD